MAEYSPSKVFLSNNSGDFLNCRLSRDRKSERMNKAVIFQEETSDSDSEEDYFRDIRQKKVIKGSKYL